MTLLGKIFTLLIFVLSVGFLALAITLFATHRNWHDEAVELEKKIGNVEEVERELKIEVQSARATLASEKAARRSVVQALGSKARMLEEENLKLNEQLGTLQATASQTAITLEARSQALAALVKEVDGLRTEIRAAQDERDQKVNLVVSLTDKINSTNGQLEMLQERRGQLVAQLTEVKNVLDAHGLRLTESPIMQAPPVDGYVTGVGKESIVFSIGSDDGLRKGHQVDVYRQNKYLGRAVVQDVRPDRAVATLDADFLKGTIKVDDRVTTTLL